MPISMTNRYSEDTEGARICLERAADMMNVATAKVPGGAEVTFVDYGCADGGTVSGLWRNTLESLLAREDVGRVHLVANDLPFNDFGTLGRNLDAVRAERDAVRVSMVPTSFYERVAAPATVGLGFTATAMHWLSELPQTIDTHTHANATEDEAAAAAFAAQAERDFQHLMLKRAEELQVGGHMVLVNLARTDVGLFLGHNGRDHNMHDELHRLWVGMREEGRITAEQYRRATFQNFYKCEAQFVAPFEDAAGPVHRAGLRLVGSRIEQVACPYRRRFEREGNAARFASGLMRTVRSWSEHTFRSAVGDDGDPDVVPELYRRFAAAVADSPHDYSMDYVQSYLHITKVAPHA